MKDTRKLKDLIEYSWLNLEESDLDYINIFDIMSEDDKKNPDIFLLDILRRPENFPLTCKWLLNLELFPFQHAIIQQLWRSPFPILLASRGASKTFLLSIYAILRALFLQGRKIVVVAAGFRQSKNLMSYVENIYNNAPVLQDLLKGCSLTSGMRRDTDRWVMRIGHSTITALPLGDGERIRGERANDTLIDEFSAIANVDIIERVIGGFSVVASSPVEKVKQTARLEKMAQLGIIKDEDVARAVLQYIPNQQIISGTAYYEFNHFAQYHKKWHKIIESKGESDKLGEIFTNSDGLVDVPEGFNWKDYSIIRVPVTLLPKNYMDMAQVSRAKATMQTGMFEMEYLCIFSRDSAGFFRASLIHNATATEENSALWNKQNIFKEDMYFTTALRGNPERQYVIGVDPAAEVDNLAIVVLELHENHRRVVHCWTYNKKKHKQLMTEGLIGNIDYFHFCARKIRELMQVFPTENLAIDMGGGGISLVEALRSANNLQPNELPLWPIIEDKEKDTDHLAGHHIIHPVQFRRLDWVAEANHGMKKDLEDKVLIFPAFDTVSVLQVEESLLDTTEEIMFEVEELKKEMMMIVHTKGATGGERWDTPETKISGQAKGRMHKDRYSALLMANMIARSLNKPRLVMTTPDGGFSSNRPADGGWLVAPDWFSSKVGNNLGFA